MLRILCCWCLFGTVSFAQDNKFLKVWPEKPAGEPTDLKLPPEKDTSNEKSRTVAGKPVIRIGNVSEPTLELFLPEKEKSNGTAVIICPGGGFNILAYDLEGTEVAHWLNKLGVAAFVLKYRVPARDKTQPWLAPVQDCQRAVSLVRSRAKEFNLNPKAIGVCGFSAGGQTAAFASLISIRKYDPIDAVDETSFRPDFGMLIYPAYLVTKDGSKLADNVIVTKNAPPMFLVHAQDDPVRPESSSLLFTALKQAGVSAEVHIFSKGGHGYGLRKTDDAVTHWPTMAELWLRAGGFIPKK
ncbi:MAG: alpha/beta hydrolase [Zavarzinella sp.]